MFCQYCGKQLSDAFENEPIQNEKIEENSSDTMAFIKTEIDTYKNFRSAKNYINDNWASTEFYNDALQYAQARFYEIAVQKYMEGSFGSAKSTFEKLSGYKEANSYYILCTARMYNPNPLKTGDFDSELYRSVLKLINFADAKDVIEDVFLIEFLSGKWQSSDGAFFFSIPQDSHKFGFILSSNIKEPSLANSSYDFEDGIIYKSSGTALVGQDNYQRMNVFKISIHDLQSIELYCYANGITYNLFKQ